MPGLASILNIARRALFSQRTGMTVASHNIANVSTPGYSRQRVNLVPGLPERVSFGMLGSGVEANRVERLRERFIDLQFRTANSSMGGAVSEQRLLSQVEAFFNEPSDTGLNAVMTRFFGSFQDLATHPEESAMRNGVLQQGLLLAQSFRGLASNITSLRSDLLTDVNAKVDRINQLAREISELDIRAVEAEPNDLLDQRDMKLDELSQLAPVNVAEDPRGSLMVSIGGTVIASRAGSTPLKAAISGNQIQITAAQSNLTINVTGGELGGILKTANVTLPGYLSQLDQVASALITRVNQLHSAGFGIGNPPPTGINFFTGTDATTIAIDPSIIGNVNNIAASGDGTPGNNTVALELSGVGAENLLNGGTTSIMQYYSGMVSGIGSTIVSANGTITSQDLILAQLGFQRSSVSGVSVDEEMTKLILFQRGFEAAARLVSSVDDMFKTIINMV
jgi:flagellar hook-associated protein 1